MAAPKEESFDDSYLKSIAENDEEFIREILTVFLTVNAENIATLKKAVDNNATIEIKDTAHKMRSSCTSVGISNANLILEEIEDYARNEKPLEKIKKKVTALEKLLDKQVSLIEKRIS